MRRIPNLTPFLLLCCYNSRDEPMPLVGQYIKKDGTKLTRGGHQIQLCGDGDLQWCPICNGAEGSLPSECPKSKMSSGIEQLVYDAELDFVKGVWFGSTDNLCKACEGSGRSTTGNICSPCNGNGIKRFKNNMETGLTNGIQKGLSAH